MPRHSRMSVPVVNVRIMGVAVRQRLMRVRMRVRLAGRVVGPVSVPVVHVVDVGMGVLQRLVGVPMGVALGEMEPEPEAHQCPGRQKAERHRFAPEERGPAPRR